MFNPDPAAYLPHRHPFLFIDRVLSLEAGAAATGIMEITRGVGGFPPLLLLESMAQLAGIAAGQQEGEGGLLAAIEKGEVHAAAVNPGDTVIVAVRIMKGFGRLFLVQGEARVDGEMVASATLTLAIQGTGTRSHEALLPDAHCLPLTKSVNP